MLPSQRTFPLQRSRILLKLLESVRNKIFSRTLRDSTDPLLLCTIREFALFERERAEGQGQGCGIVAYRVLSVLRVLFHAAIDCLQSPDATTSAEQLLFECHRRLVLDDIRILRQAHRATLS